MYALQAYVCKHVFHVVQMWLGFHIVVVSISTDLSHEMFTVNQYAGSFKKLFEASSQTCFLIFTTRRLTLTL